MSSMSDRTFIDTNVLIYAHDVDANAKHEIAKVVLRELWSERTGVLSMQVLQEFYTVVTRKSERPLAPAQALEWIELLEVFPCAPIDASLVKRGAENSARYRISYWDGAILAAAEALGASTLYSEDLNHGQTYGAVSVRNPFKDQPKTGFHEDTADLSGACLPKTAKSGHRNTKF